MVSLKTSQHNSSHFTTRAEKRLLAYRRCLHTMRTTSTHRLVEQCPVLASCRTRRLPRKPNCSGTKKKGRAFQFRETNKQFASLKRARYIRQPTNPSSRKENSPRAPLTAQPPCTTRPRAKTAVILSRTADAGIKVQRGWHRVPMPAISSEDIQHTPRAPPHNPSNPSQMQHEA